MRLTTPRHIECCLGLCVTREETGGHSSPRTAEHVNHTSKKLSSWTHSPPHSPPLAILSKPIERGQFYAVFSLLRAVSSDLQEVFCHDHIEFVISASRQESHVMTTTQRFGGFKRYPNQGMFPYRTFQSKGFTLHCFFLCGWMIQVWKPKDEASLIVRFSMWRDTPKSPQHLLDFGGFSWLPPFWGLTKSLASTQ